MNNTMERGSTIFLKVVIIGLGLTALATCAFGLPWLIMDDNTGYYKPILIGMYVPAIPFFIALFKAFGLLSLIDKNKAFSEEAVGTLSQIKYCGLAISAMYAAGMPYIFYAADRDDAPGVVLIGLIIIFAAFVITVFAALLQKILQRALDIKSENDLTV